MVDRERLVTMLAIIIGYTLLVGSFVGAWTGVQIEGYRRHSRFSNRLNLIKNLLVSHKQSWCYIKALFVIAFFWSLSDTQVYT